jgi:hypothetical protein
MRRRRDLTTATVIIADAKIAKMEIATYKECLIALNEGE